MAKITQQAFIAVQQFEKGKPMLLTWATSTTAQHVRKVVGEAWDTDGNGHSWGWEQAKKNCVRVVKVQITADLPA